MLVALESVAALALAHLAAGGEGLDPWWLAAFGVLVYAASGVVLRGRAGIRVVLPALLAVQVLGHAWLVALSPGTHLGHGHATVGLLGLTPSMLAAHVVAAAVTGVMWALRRRAVDVLLRWADQGRPPLPAGGSRRLAATAAPVAHRWHVGTAPTRGPPSRLLVTA